jgi:hypothetical protein
MAIAGGASAIRHPRWGRLHALDWTVVSVNIPAGQCSDFPKFAVNTTLERNPETGFKMGSRLTVSRGKNAIEPDSAI